MIDRFPEFGTLTGQTTNHANRAIDLLTKPDIVHLVDNVNLDDALGRPKCRGLHIRQDAPERLTCYLRGR